MVAFNKATAKLMKSCAGCPPREPQSETCTGRITLSRCRRLQWVREPLEKEGFDLPLQTGN
jgi:arylsulfatase